MTDAPVDDLESSIRVALRERAATFLPMPREPIDAATLSVRGGIRPRHGGHPRRMMLIGILVAVLGGLGAVAWLVTDSGSSTVVHAPGVGGPRPVGAGRQMPLTTVKTPMAVRSSLQSPASPLVAGTHPVTVRPDGLASITVSEQVTQPGGTRQRCIHIQEPTRPPAVWDVSGTCGPLGQPAPEMQQLFYYPHADSQADPVVLYVWSAVPDGTKYVTFDSPLLRAWERPLHGLVVFPVRNGPVEAVVVAFDAQHQPLATVNAKKLYTGARPHPQPSRPRPIRSTRPPWYDLKGTLRWCDHAPLEEIRPEGSRTFKAFDHATGGVVEINSRENCKEEARLAPDPMGDFGGISAIVNGKVHVEYHERITKHVNGGEISSEGASIPFDEAQRRIAAQRAAATAACHAAKKRHRTLPQCVGG